MKGDQYATTTIQNTTTAATTVKTKQKTALGITTEKERGVAVGKATWTQNHQYNDISNNSNNYKAPGITTEKESAVAVGKATWAHNHQYNNSSNKYIKSTTTIKTAAVLKNHENNN